MDEELIKQVTSTVDQFVKDNPDQFCPSGEDDNVDTPASTPRKDVEPSRRTTTDKSILGKNKIDLRTKKGKTIIRALTTISKKKHQQSLINNYEKLPLDQKVKYSDLSSFIYKKMHSDNKLWCKMKSLIQNKRKRK